MYEDINNLLDRSQKGDVEGKEELLINLKPLVLSSIRKYYNRVELYDDLIQEGYEIILLAIGDYDPGKGVYFLGYVKSLLKYHYLDKHKEKQYASINKIVDDKGTELIDLLEGEEKEPLESLIDRQDTMELVENLNCLTYRQREIVLDFYVNRLSISKIADKLDISYRTVVNTKTRALNKLKKAMVK